MAETGFTKARSMGPVAEAVERAGGSVARVFRQAELPLRLIETPDQLILLKDQLALVEYAARELDDEMLPLRLSMESGMAGLGLFGRRVRTASTLRDAIERCNRGIGSMLQSATHMRLSVRDGLAAWSYEISDAAVVGRQKNELLAFGYMLETLRHLGAGAIARAALPQRPLAHAQMRDMLGCEIVAGETAALVFPAERLERRNPLAGPVEDGCADDVPPSTDFIAGVEQLMRLALLDRRPTIDYVSRRLALSARTLQRRLNEAGACFESIRRRVLLERAVALLGEPNFSITEIAYELGYSDPAHFSRAFTHFTGESPRDWRRMRPDIGRLASAAARP